MNTKSSQYILGTDEGLLIAHEEVEKIKKGIYDFVAKMNSKAPLYNIQIRDNPTRICNLSFKGYTLLAQFNQAYVNSAYNSYLLFAVVEGLFDANGNADPFNPATVKEIIRLDFSYNEKGEFGWRDRESKNDFYLSMDITETWTAKYFKTVLI